MAIDIDELGTKVRKLRDAHSQRDARWADLMSIRQGNIQQVFPGAFTDEFPKPMVSNFIDIAARDVAEVIAPLPAFNCDTTDAVSDRARKRADKRTMIASGYRDSCNLQTQMYTGADRYITFGMVAFIVEPDYENNRPMIRIDNPIGSYPEFDRFNKLISYTRRYQKSVRELCNDFPEIESQIRGPYENRNSERRLELFRYQDKNELVLFIPERKNLILERAKNTLGELPVVIATRPGVDSDEHQRGQFDDIMWVQVARSRFATLQLEAAQKSVQAPFALPSDVNVLEIGPDATIRSANPEKIRRVALDIPNGIFQESQSLDQELRVGSRYPQGRLGQQSGSIVTGRGVEALMGGFDTQIKTAQAVFAETFRHVMRMCFMMDEKLFGDVTKEVRGVNAGAPYEITYTPLKDIQGDYWCDVTYGMMAGLDPNRALVFGLQARGDKLISRDFLRRQMPWEMNVTMEEEKVEVEQLRDALMQAVAGYAQALPAMVEQGQDPSKVLAAMASIIDGRQKGEQIEAVVAAAFAPTPAPEVSPEVAAAGAAPEGAPGQAPTGEPTQAGQPSQQQLPPGLNASGRLQGVAPGQQGMAPGGRPALQSLLAGLSSSGQPTLSAGVLRRTPV
jgi:hypothetical protein